MLNIRDSNYRRGFKRWIGCVQPRNQINRGGENFSLSFGNQNLASQILVLRLHDIAKFCSRRAERRADSQSRQLRFEAVSGEQAQWHVLYLPMLWHQWN